MRAGAWAGMAACGVALLGAAVCEEKPTVAKVAGYTLTLPPGWNTNEEPGEGVVFASLDSFADDVECQLQFYSLPVEREAFDRIMHEEMKATNIAPASLDTALGKFEGTTFDAKLPSDSALGKLAQLAGTPKGEAYFGGPPDKPIGAMIVTFALDDEPERLKMRAKCATALASLRR